MREQYRASDNQTPAGEPLPDYEALLDEFLAGHRRGYGLGLTRGREVGTRLGAAMGFMAGTRHGMDLGYANGHREGFRAGVAHGIAHGQVQWNW